MPQAQFLNRIVDVRVMTQRQIAVQRVQKKIVIPHVQCLARWSMVLLCGSQVYVTDKAVETHSRRSCSNTLRSPKSRLAARTPTAQHPESKKPSR